MRPGPSVGVTTAQVDALSLAQAETLFLDARYTHISSASFATSGASGAGAGSSVTEFGIALSSPNAGVSGSVYRRYVPGAVAPMSIEEAAGIVGFGRGLCLGFKMLFTAVSVNQTTRVVIGRAAADAVGALAKRGIALVRQGTGVLQIQGHDGTSLGTLSTDGTFTPVTGQTYRALLVLAAGTGAITLYVNGVQVASATGGPTTDIAAATDNGIGAEIETTGVTTVRTDAFVGGWAYKLS